jgi:hypothetical protein
MFLKFGGHGLEVAVATNASGSRFSTTRGRFVERCLADSALGRLKELSQLVVCHFEQCSTGNGHDPLLLKTASIAGTIVPNQGHYLISYRIPTHPS